MSREACTALLAAKDRSALILSKYVPAVAQDGWMALRALNVETARVVDGAREPAAALARMQYWKSGIQRAYTAAGTAGGSSRNSSSSSPGSGSGSGSSSSPGSGGGGGGGGGTDNYHGIDDHRSALALLTQALKSGARIPKRYLLTLVQTREHQLMQPPVRTVEDLARIGEGSASQVLYATFDLLQAQEAGTTEFLAAHPDLDEHVSSILAHIGQAQGIAGALRALRFYAERQNRLIMPLDVLKKHGVSEQAVLDGGGSEHNHRMQNAVFEVATAANDHILSARLLLDQFKERTGGKTPKSLFVSAMGALPTVLYLERLQKTDFDISRTSPEWRLPWRTWRAFRTRRI